MEKQVCNCTLTHLFLGLFVLISSVTNGQVTITRDKFFIESTVRYDETIANTIPVIKTTEGSIWDLYKATKTGKIYSSQITKNVLNPFFSGSSFSKTDSFMIGKVSVLQNKYYGSGTFIAQLGYEYNPVQSRSIAYLTGNPNDFVSVPIQISQFQFTPIEISFPTTSQSKWSWGKSQPIVIRTEFALTLNAEGLSGVKCTLVSKMATQYLGVCSGTCKIPSKVGNITFPALLIKQEETRTDSLYVNNSPASKEVLDALGIQQGIVVNTYRYRFLREGGGMQCLGIITYTNNTYTTVKEAYTSREFDGLGVGDVQSSYGISVYPNPSNGDAFTVQLAGNEENVDFTLYDLSGKEVPMSASKVSHQTYQLIPNDKICGGIYTLRLITNTKTGFVRLVIQ